MNTSLIKVHEVFTSLILIKLHQVFTSLILIKLHQVFTSLNKVHEVLGPEHARMVLSKHLRIQNKTKQNKTKLVHHFDFGQPKQNKIIYFLILFDQN